MTSTMKVSFRAKDFESDFYGCAAACNKFMAKNHGKEPFYGFCLYVPTYYTDCGIFYNTDSLYEKTLQEYQAGEFGAEYRAEKEVRWNLRWNIGDWSYSTEADTPTGLRPLIEKMERWEDNARNQMDDKEITDDDWQEYGAALMTSTCRVMKQLHDDGMMELLPRTKDFHALIQDHDEAAIPTLLRYEVFAKDGTVIMPWDSFDEDGALVKRALKEFQE
jgi:hypothetical protein